MYRLRSWLADYGSRCLICEIAYKVQIQGRKGKYSYNVSTLPRTLHIGRWWCWAWIWCRWCNRKWNGLSSKNESCNTTKGRWGPRSILREWSRKILQSWITIRRIWKVGWGSGSGQHCTCEDRVESMVDVGGCEERGNQEAEREQQLQRQQTSEVEGEAHEPTTLLASNPATWQRIR